jgi:hypothetical protein
MLEVNPITVSGCQNGYPKKNEIFFILQIRHCHIHLSIFSKTPCFEKAKASSRISPKSIFLS